MRGNAWLVGLVVGAVACGPPPRNGAGDDDVAAPDASAPGGDGSGNGCAQGAESVYVIDHLLEHLFRFDPPTKSFTDLGQPFCPTSGKPFSMGVDRNAVAWLLYDTGELFEVQLNNALMCTKTTSGYAFAHWGGNYWVFLMKNSEPSTTVYEIDGTTGAIVDTIPTIRTIVGAGVSTCAPTVLL